MTLPPPYQTIPNLTKPNQEEGGREKYEEVVEQERGKKIKSPRVQRSQGLKVQGSQGPKDQDISKSYSNTSLTLKKVHLVLRRYYFPAFTTDIFSGPHNNAGASLQPNESCCVKTWPWNRLLPPPSLPSPVPGDSPGVGELSPLPDSDPLPCSVHLA